MFANISQIHCRVRISLKRNNETVVKHLSRTPSAFANNGPASVHVHVYRERERERGREGGREGERGGEGRREIGREGGREGGRERQTEREKTSPHFFLTFCEARSGSSWHRRARNPFFSRHSVVLVVRKTVPPTFSFTHSSRGELDVRRGRQGEKLSSLPPSPLPPGCSSAAIPLTEGSGLAAITTHTHTLVSQRRTVCNWHLFQIQIKAHVVGVKRSKYKGFTNLPGHKFLPTWANNSLY